MKNIITKFSWPFILGGCTFGSISSIPMEIDGIGTVYRYQGRANFSHQIAAADQMIAEDCKQRNGGKPVIVDLKKQYLGQIGLSSGDSRTYTNANAIGTGNSTFLSGVSRTTSSNTQSSFANYNQEIIYKCVASPRENNILSTKSLDTPSSYGFPLENNESQIKPSKNPNEYYKRRLNY